MTPKASRPYMPGYGIVGPQEGRGLLPWSWAEQRLTSSHDYWVATVSHEGRPHVMPVWAVWYRTALWFSSSDRARKTRNLAANPRAMVTTDNPLEPVVVEGDVERVRDSSSIASFAACVNDKYATDYPVTFFTENACFKLLLIWAFGLDERDFTGTPTRWTFES